MTRPPLGGVGTSVVRSSQGIQGMCGVVVREQERDWNLPRGEDKARFAAQGDP